MICFKQFAHTLYSVEDLTRNSMTAHGNSSRQD